MVDQVPLPAGRRPYRASATLLGVGALAMWALYATLVVGARGLPPFLTLAVLFSAATLVLLLRRVILGNGFADIFQVPLATLLLGFLGIFGSNAAYVLAIGTGVDPVGATILSFSWPILMVIIVVAAGISRATSWDGLALLLGFSGMSIAALGDGRFSLHPGLILAFLSGLCWALYSGLRTLVPAGPQDSTAAFNLWSAVAAWTLHFALEPTTSLDVANLWQLATVAIAGVLAVGIANLMWDIGAREGDPVLLASLAFAEPILSTGLLALFVTGKYQFGNAISLALVMAGAGASMVSERRRRQTA